MLNNVRICIGLPHIRSSFQDLLSYKGRNQGPATYLDYCLSHTGLYYVDKTYIRNNHNFDFML